MPREAMRLANHENRAIKKTLIPKHLSAPPLVIPVEMGLTLLYLPSSTDWKIIGVERRNLRKLLTSELMHHGILL